MNNSPEETIFVVKKLQSRLCGATSSISLIFRSHVYNDALTNKFLGLDPAPQLYVIFKKLCGANLLIEFLEKPYRIVRQTRVMVHFQIRL